MKQIIEEKQTGVKTRHTAREFQDFGYRLAVELEDLKHKSLYMKLAKEKPRSELETARRFARDVTGNKGAAFMWKLGQLKKERKKA